MWRLLSFANFAISCCFSLSVKQRAVIVQWSHVYFTEDSHRVPILLGTAHEQEALNKSKSAMQQLMKA